MEFKEKKILKILSSLYPNPKTELIYSSPFEFLVAAILSAQCTDARVNIVTRNLFKHYNTPNGFANISEDKLISFIRSCGFFNNKAKNIILCAQKIDSEFNGVLPGERHKLESLAGVGRKTANVVLSNIFHIPAIAVDTHVFRVSKRLGLSVSSSPLGVEKDLMRAFPEKSWNNIHHQLIFHGRRVCRARKPKCADCQLNPYCAYFSSIKTKQRNIPE